MSGLPPPSRGRLEGFHLPSIVVRSKVVDSSTATHHGSISEARLKMRAEFGETEFDDLCKKRDLGRRELALCERKREEMEAELESIYVAIEASPASLRVLDSEFNRQRNNHVIPCMSSRL